MVSKNYLRLESMPAYTIASDLADYVWDIVLTWQWFEKKTLGVQYANAMDSVAGNIAEGFGRFHKKDKQKFYYNARGSLLEAKHWTEKARKRNLLNEKDYQYILSILLDLPRRINWLIKITQEKLTF